MNKRALAMVTLIFAMFMDLIDSTALNTALPAIEKDLNATAAQLEWTIGGYMLAFATLLITGGRLGDIVGRRHVFVIGVAGFTLASLLASLSTTGDLLVAARIAQGAFAGIMVPQVLSNVQVLYKPEERGPVFGIIGMIIALASVVGLLLGGWFVTSDAFGVGWRSIFLVNIPVGALLVIAAFLFVPNSRAENPVKLDLVGVLLTSAATFLLTYALFDGRHVGWPTWIWAMIIASPILLAVFVWQQKRKLLAGGDPLLPMHLFGNRGFVSGLLVQLTFWAATGSYMLMFGYYLQKALGFSALEVGLTLVAMTLGAVIATPIVTPLLKKHGKSLVILGGVLQAASFVWVMRILDDDDGGLSGWGLAIPIAVAGIGMIFQLHPLMDISLATVPPEDAGAASGTFTTFQQIGFVLGVAIGGVVFFGIATTPQTAENLERAVTTGLWVTVISFGLASAFALFMPKPDLSAASREAGGERLENAVR
jgi:EmrB/QacA subfamily drug resistance transporter